MSEQMQIDPAKLDAFLGKAVGDMGATLNAALVMIGDRLGLYRTLAEGGAMTPAKLALEADCRERYVREWCCAQAAGGYLEYTPEDGTFTLPPEQAFTLANPDSPVFLPGGFQVALGALRAEPQIAERFKSGEGFGWHEHHPDLFHGTERFFRASYLGELVSSWIPALEGVAARLEAGARVADIGCGHGASTVVMAKAFPSSTFSGFDYHPSSVEAARKRAEAAGVADRVRFEVAAARDIPGDGYDFVAFFDCLHDMGDPVAAARRVREALAPGGTLMVVEPVAGDRIEDNLNPVGRIYYAASTMICTPASLSQEGGRALGAQAGEKVLSGVLAEAGFGHVRCASRTPFNMVLEARA